MINYLLVFQKLTIKIKLIVTRPNNNNNEDGNSYCHNNMMRGIIREIKWRRKRKRRIELCDEEVRLNYCIYTFMWSLWEDSPRRVFECTTILEADPPLRAYITFWNIRFLKRELCC